MGVLAVFLVGFMGSGKSSVGQELARRLNWEFVDLDARIEARERQSIPEIFRQAGEPGFRLAETAALRELKESMSHNTVVALGGGAFVPDANRELIGRSPSVFLEAGEEELWRRCSEHNVVRPLRTNREQFSRLYAQRLPSYRQATVVVATSGKTISSICAEIERTLRLTEPRRPGAAPAMADPANFEPGGTQ